jgi:hypothetical protein
VSARAAMMTVLEVGGASRREPGRSVPPTPQTSSSLSVSGPAHPAAACECFRCAAA